MRSYIVQLNILAFIINHIMGNSIIGTSQVATIRQLSSDDFEIMYQIWEEGIAIALSNPGLTGIERRSFYRNFFRDGLSKQDHNFKFWGYFVNDKLVGWQSLLPCQSAPMVWHKYAESSTYIKSDSRYRGVGRTLLLHAIKQARLHSELAYIMGYVSDGNPHVEKLVQEVGFQKIGPLPKSSKDDICGKVEGQGFSDNRTLVVYCIAL